MGMLDAFWGKRSTPDDFQVSVRSAIAASVTGMQAHLTAVARSTAADSAAVAALRAEQSDIHTALAQRWPGATASAVPTGAGVPADVPHMLRSSRLPWFESGRTRRLEVEMAIVRQRLFEIDRELEAVLAKISEQWARSLPSAVRVPAGPVPSLPPAIADAAESLDRAVAGEGPLVIQVGSFVWDADAVVPADPTAGPWSIGARRESAFAGSDSVPALIDLVADGGFATDHRPTVQSAVVRLLALLPAGSCKIHLFDPVRVGASLPFLNDLDETAFAAVTENRVIVVPSELDVVLDDLIKHIARVTQQYLGSRHRTLAEYNRAAGEVAEPYRVLVLMDHPTGRSDDETERKLQTVVNAGPACGVFVFLHSPDPGRHSGGLPVLVAGAWAAVDQLPASARRSFPTVPSPGGIATGSALVTAISTGSPNGVVALDPRHGWVGSAWDPSLAPEVARLVRRLDAQVGAIKRVSVSAAVTAQRANGRRGVTGRPVRADPGDQSTWWQQRSDRGLEAVVGVSGDRNVAIVNLHSADEESNLLVAGQPGSGKSVLLHALINDLARNYPPGEVEFFLLDPKEGVEFAVYAHGGLPHARVITVSAPAESTVTVLGELREEIGRRGRVFTAVADRGGPHVANIDAYRAVPGVPPMPHVVVVIDEFQALLNTGDDDESMRISRLLDELVRIGRAFGMHLVLATQSLSGIRHLPAAVTSLMPARVAFQMDEEDSRLFLSRNDLDAARLGAGGRAIFQHPGRSRMESGSVQERVQVTNETSTEIETTTAALAARDPRRPTVVNTSRRRPPSTATSRAMREALTPAGLSLVVARGLGATEPVTGTLGASPDAHALVVLPPGPDPEAPDGFSVVSMMIATCAATRVPFDVVDLGEVQGAFAQRLEEVRRGLGGPGRRFGRRTMLSRYLAEAATAVTGAAAAIGARPDHRVIFVLNAQAAPDVFDDPDVADALRTILAVGARRGTHVVVHSETGDAALRIAPVSSFALRVVGPVDRDVAYDLLGVNAGPLPREQVVVRTGPGGLRRATLFAPLRAATWARL